MASTNYASHALVTCALLGATSLASAQPSPEAEVIRLRLQAEAHEKRDEPIACAETYLTIDRQFPNAKGGDEVLYNAGVCFEDGKSVGHAIKTFGKLLARFPTSRLAPRARVRIGNAAASIANFERAAQAYEGYVRRHAGEKDAPDALADAITYRKALGHNKNAIDNIETFVRNYHRKLASESASALFASAAIYEGQGDTNKMVGAYKRYIKTMGKRGGVDRLVIANAKIGTALWEQSCSAAGEDDSCVRVVRRKMKFGRKIKPGGKIKPALPTHCGPDRNRVLVLPRSRRLSAEAKKYFERTLSLSQQGTRAAASAGPWPGAADSAASARRWTEMARFYGQEEAFEALLSLRFPSNLDFDPRRKEKTRDSERRFSIWLKSMKERSMDLRKSYGEIGKKSTGVSRVAVLARAAQTSLHFTKQVQGAEIPISVRTGPYAKEGVDAYCSTLTSAAVPLEEEAIAAFAECLTLSRELDHFDRWSRLCERELATLRPEDFPLPAELHNASRAAGEVLSLTPLLLPPS